MAFCKYCGHELRDGANFCKKCGKEVGATPKPPDNVYVSQTETTYTPVDVQPNSRKKSSVSRKIIIAVIIVAIVVGILTAAIFTIRQILFYNGLGTLNSTGYVEAVFKPKNAEELSESEFLSSYAYALNGKLQDANSLYYYNYYSDTRIHVNEKDKEITIWFPWEAGEADTGYLEVLDSLNMKSHIYFVTPDYFSNQGTGTILTTEDMLRIEAIEIPDTNGYGLYVQFTENGKEKFAEVTEEYVGMSIYVLLDMSPIAMPVVNEPIIDGEVTIPLDMGKEQVEAVADAINVPYLAYDPETVKVVPPNKFGSWVYNLFSKSKETGDD